MESFLVANGEEVSPEKSDPEGMTAQRRGGNTSWLQHKSHSTAPLSPGFSTGCFERIHDTFIHVVITCLIRVSDATHARQVESFKGSTKAKQPRDESLGCCEWHCRVRIDGGVCGPSVDACWRFRVILRHSRVGLGLLGRSWLRFGSVLLGWLARGSQGGLFHGQRHGFRPQRERQFSASGGRVFDAAGVAVCLGVVGRASAADLCQTQQFVCDAWHLFDGERVAGVPHAGAL